MIKLSSFFGCFLSILTPSFSATAAEVLIENTSCVSASTTKTHEYITNYDGYASSPGSAYEIDLSVFGKLKLLEMIKSQSQFKARTDTATDGFAWVILRSMNVENSAYYPKFLLHCISNKNLSGFHHECSLVKDKLHYGLQDFRSNLEIIESDLSCNGGTRLKYTLTLVSQPNEVAELKRETLKPAGRLLAPVLEKLFDENSFFRDYFNNFYKGWVTELNQ